jgi:hypothetical protein
MSASEKNQYWIPNLDINKKVIVTEIQCYLGPEATVRAYTYEVLDLDGHTQSNELICQFRVRKGTSSSLLGSA